MGTISIQTVTTGEITNNVVDIYKKLMAASTGVDSVYLKAKETLMEAFQEGTMNATDKAEIIATMITQLTNNISTQSMNIAYALAKYNQEAPFLLAKTSEETRSLSTNIDALDEDIALKQQQLADMIRKHNEDAGKWVINELILGNQKSMSDVDVTYKPLISAEDLTTKQKQIEGMIADIAFNTSKKEVMENTRNDNIRMKATEQFAELLKYISAADVVPSETDFTNIRRLVTSIMAGISNPTSVAIIDDPTEGSKSYQNK